MTMHGGYEAMTKISRQHRSCRTAPLLRAAAAVILLSGIGSPTAATEDDAKAILKAMADYLAAQQTLSWSFDSDIEIITPEMEKIQFASSGEGLLSRPDKLRARRVGGYSDVELIFDGKTMSIHDRGGNGYVQVEAAATVDQLTSALRAGHGVAKRTQAASQAYLC